MEMNDYMKYIALSRYARWLPEQQRRETWDETVNRYVTYFVEKYPEHRAILETSIKPAIINLEVMPSMRMLMTAGAALDKDNVAGYNCAYLAVDSPRAFDETMYILMCGTGVGFSVERQYVAKLPDVAEEFFPSDTTIVVPDSKVGWATSYRELVAMLYNGKIPKWDMSKVRPAGAPLKTFGGRASGSKPLNDLFHFTVDVFRKAKGRKLSSIECHDIMCKIADIVVVGGVRRSALISLSNLTDDRMRHAKSGQWWLDNPQRALANNSVAYTEKPDMQAFMREWLALVESGSGERGIFYRGAAERLIPDRRKESNYKDYGCNPCSEIVLRSKQFCNLTECVIRAEDNLDTLKRKVELATIMGTFQATQTNFRYLSSTWKKNTEDEALLGVSFTGIMDNAFMAGHPDLPVVLEQLRDHARAINEEWAAKLGINRAAAITCVKPSGTVSQLVDSASGIHSRHSDYYIRTVRADKKDPLAKMMIDAGFPVEDDVMKPDTGYVFSFPTKSPANATTRDDKTAIQQLELWKLYQLHWCEHKPSVTITVREEEWLEVGAWVYANFDIMSGVSFLPHSNHTYQQAPYQDITKDEYEAWLPKMPQNVDWTLLKNYERTDDAVSGVREFACTGNTCEIV